MRLFEWLTNPRDWARRRRRLHAYQAYLDLPMELRHDMRWTDDEPGDPEPPRINRVRFG